MPLKLQVNLLTTLLSWKTTSCLPMQISSEITFFNRAFGDHYLLMPNRIETMEHQGQLRRFYIDGDYNPSASAAYRHSTEKLLSFPHLGEMVRFEQPSNLHSGCFSSTASRLEPMPAAAMQR